MKKLITIGIVLTLLTVATNFYVTNYYCTGDDYCLYTIGDGITENLVYLSLTFLVASLFSLIAKNNKPWMITFGILTFVTLLSSQTCSAVGCYSREAVLIITITGTLLVALITNLMSKLKK